MEEAMSSTSKFEREVCKKLGVTPAGLSYLAKLVSKGMAPQRGNEATPLLAKGLIQPTRDTHYINYESKPYEITDAGREIVRRARSMGW